MYAIVRTIQAQAGQRETLITQWEQTVAPHLRQLPGLQAGYLLATPDSDEVVLVSVWDDEAAMQAWQSSTTHQELHAQLAAQWAAPSTVTSYDVRVQVQPARVPPEVQG